MTTQTPALPGPGFAEILSLQELPATALTGGFAAGPPPTTAAGGAAPELMATTHHSFFSVASDCTSSILTITAD